MGKTREDAFTVVNAAADPKEPLSQVDILKAPSPIVIRKAIGIGKLGLIHHNDGAEELTDNRRRKAWVQASRNEHRRPIAPSIVRDLREKINIVETHVIDLWSEDFETHIVHEPAVERSPMGLLRNKDSYREVRLSSKKIPQMGDEHRQMLSAITIWHDNAELYGHQCWPGGPRSSRLKIPANFTVKIFRAAPCAFNKAPQA
jgi:hypothetical protein